MSQQDIETVRGAYAAFNRQDFPSVLGQFDSAVEWTEPGGGNSVKGTFRGGESIAREVWSTIPANFTEFQVLPDRYVDAGDSVLAIGNFRVAAKNGQRFEVPFVHVLDMRGGKVVRFVNYVEMPTWSRAWGG